MHGTLQPAPVAAGEASVGSGEGGPPARHGKRLFLLLALLTLLVGSAASYQASSMIARDAAMSSRQSFESSSQDVASALHAQLVRQADLVVQTAAFISTNPRTTNRRFQQWADQVGVMSGYPEVLSLTYVKYIPATALPAFEAQIKSDPPGTLPAGGGFNISPPGNRPYYCLVDAAVSRQASQFPLTLDYCTGSVGQDALRARDTGAPLYTALNIDGVKLFAVGTPMYSGGLVPKTLAGRQAGFVGFLGTSVNPLALLQNALTSHRSLGVAFSYQNGPMTSAYHAGVIRPGDASKTQSLGQGWTLRTYGPTQAASIGADGGALALFAVGLALSAVLAALLLVLSLSRARALRLVDQRTGELRYQALHDSLTGLPNRALVADRAEQLLLRNRRNKTDAAALYLDLDDFKTVNDTLGHGAGDQLLRAVADRLRSGLRTVDTIGRLGGDEFVVLIDGSDQAAGPELVAERIVDILRQPFDLPGAAMPVVVSISVGVAVGDRVQAEDLLRDADVALYQAKDKGKNGFQVFRPEFESELRRRGQIDLDVRSALQSGQLFLAYQPIYDLGDLSLIGFEALLRWSHPTLGEVVPAEFIPLLESNGQIVDVGRFVMTEACAQLAKWRHHDAGLTMAVNVSARQLRDDRILADVTAALESSQLEPAALTLEITETTLMTDIDRTVERLTQLKAIGVSLAIDDFGTGYSGLAYIQRFPVDSLKIDQTFTQSLASSPDADILVHSMVQLGKNLGLRTVAEGIESMTQVDRLRHENVDEAQGFLFAKPLSPENIEKRFLNAVPSPQPPGR